MVATPITIKVINNILLYKPAITWIILINNTKLFLIWLMQKLWKSRFSSSTERHPWCGCCKDDNTLVLPTFLLICSRHGLKHEEVHNPPYLFKFFNSDLNINKAYTNCLRMVNTVVVYIWTDAQYTLYLISEANS